MNDEEEVNVDAESVGGDQEGEDEVLEDVALTLIPPDSHCNAPCWQYFKVICPTHHPKLEGYVKCLLCPTQISQGKDSSTGGMNKHLMFKHVDVYKEMMAKKHAQQDESGSGNKKGPKNQITKHFKPTEKKTEAESKRLYLVAAVTCASTHGLTLSLFTKPAFRNMFGAISKTAHRIVNVDSVTIRKEILTLGMITEEATRIEIRGKHVSYTSDHWTGPNDETYTTVTAHFIDVIVWEMKSICLDFEVFSGRTTGEQIYKDIKTVLSKFLVEGDSDFVQDTIGITDTTGNMGKLGQFLRENGHEHAYCTDHVFHLTASLAFSCKYYCLITCCFIHHDEDCCSPHSNAAFLYLFIFSQRC